MASIKDFYTRDRCSHPMGNHNQPRLFSPDKGEFFFFLLQVVEGALQTRAGVPWARYGGLAACNEALLYVNPTQTLCPLKVCINMYEKSVHTFASDMKRTVV